MFQILLNRGRGDGRANGRNMQIPVYLFHDGKRQFNRKEFEHAVANVERRVKHQIPANGQLLGDANNGRTTLPNGRGDHELLAVFEWRQGRLAKEGRAQHAAGKHDQHRRQPARDGMLTGERQRP